MAVASRACYSVFLAWTNRRVTNWFCILFVSPLIICGFQLMFYCENIEVPAKNVKFVHIIKYIKIRVFLPNEGPYDTFITYGTTMLSAFKMSILILMRYKRPALIDTWLRSDNCLIARWPLQLLLIQSEWNSHGSLIIVAHCSSIAYYCIVSVYGAVIWIKTALQYFTQADAGDGFQRRRLLLEYKT